MRRFKKLAADAGHLLVSLPSAFQRFIPPETLGLADLPMCWVLGLFDLAWANIPGSPLHRETNKTVQFGIDPDIVDPDTGRGDIPADDLSTFVLPGSEDESEEVISDTAPQDALLGGKKGRKPRTAKKIGSRPEPFLRPCKKGKLGSKVWTNNIPLVDWPNYVKEYPRKDAICNVNDPPEWFSELTDVVQASIYAIDILLTDPSPKTLP